jgi:hypothetical protein
MNAFGAVALPWVMLLMSCCAGCVSRPPTIAHVHIGHALTAVQVTPNHEGYLVQAEERARQASDSARRAAASRDLVQVRKNVAAAVIASDSDEGFGVKQSVALAANHVAFAATSDDASANVQRSAPVFVASVSRVLERCELIRLLGDDVAESTSVEEALASVEQIRNLADANVSGDDADEDGQVGSAPAEYGLAQLRQELEGMVSRESPPYGVVDRWYLFNLVKLPSGKWIFDRFGRGSTGGYK